MLKAFDHIMSKNIQKAIISCAWFYDQVQPSNPLFQKVYEPPVQALTTNALVQWLSLEFTSSIKKRGNILIVTTTGHAGLAERGKYLPPTSDAEKYPDIVIPVGASDRQDRKMFDDVPGSDKISIKAWAPGEGIHVHGYDEAGDPSVVLVSGVAFAAASVVGMLAVYISEDVPVLKAAQQLYDLAWARVPGGPNIIWNGITESEWPGPPRKQP
ncbi:hypothetical protein TWF281_010838 [Arthrobotrys megalospora]